MISRSTRAGPSTCWKPRGAAVRATAMLFTSTNKVYGALDDVSLVKTEQRYVPVNPQVRDNGISEIAPLDFHSPYGCSKGAADQYVLDYARSYGLPAVVFRMSCIYGPHQFGNEDQGWVAHFLIRARGRQPLTLFGDGCQVRDVLYVGDLVEAFLLARHNMSRLAGQAFNIGGGAAQYAEPAASCMALAERAARTAVADSVRALAHGRPALLRLGYAALYRRRPGWRARVSPSEGIERAPSTG